MTQATETQPTARKAAVYRLYNAEGALLYIGSAYDPAVRARKHQTKKPWGGEIATREDTWYPNRVKAYDAESAAIRAEAPRYNVMCTEAWQAECSRKAREVESHRGRVRAGSAAAHKARGHSGPWGNRRKPPADGE